MTARPRLLDQVRDAPRVRHYSIRTEETYVQWIKRFIHFHGKRHPAEIGAPEVMAFLSDLAVRGCVAASTQNQALSALLYPDRHVLERDLAWLDDVTRAKRPARLPAVLDRAEVTRLFEHMCGINQLIARLLYGTGMRLMEGLRLRVQDLDLEYVQIIVRAGKGDKDRTTVLPTCLKDPLGAQLEYARRLHQRDLADGQGRVYLPFALARKYPNAAREWGWQYVFPSASRSVDPQTDEVGRHHLCEKNLQRTIKAAAVAAGLYRRVSSHTLRHYSGARIIPS